MYLWRKIDIYHRTSFANEGITYMNTSILSILLLMFGMCVSCVFVGIFPDVLSVILGCIDLKDG